MQAFRVLDRGAVGTANSAVAGISGVVGLCAVVHSAGLWAARGIRLCCALHSVYRDVQAAHGDELAAAGRGFVVAVAAGGGGQAMLLCLLLCLLFHFFIGIATFQNRKCKVHLLLFTAPFII